MDKNIILKSLINGIITWLVVGLFLSLTKDTTFVETLITPYTLFAASACIGGSFIGFKRKAGL